MGSRMYSDYFGITENAFSITPDPRYLYMSERHCEALAHLLYGVVESGCFVLLTGEVGTGKTTVCRAMLEQLPDNIDVALLLNPPQSDRELLLAISDEMGIDISRRDTSLHELVYILTRRLLENHSNGRRTVVIIDEAQNISVDVLEQVRLLTNLETSTEKLLHVILVGQPELREQLSTPALRQVSQRITARYHLEPLDASETENYVQHRLTVAGARQGLFTSGALRQLHHESQGIPRVINILCDRALLGAFANDLPQVCREQIRRAAREWRNRMKPALNWPGWRNLAVPAAAAGMLFMAALVSAYSDGWQRVLPVPEPPAEPLAPAALPQAESALPAIAPAMQSVGTAPVPELIPEAIQLVGPGSSPEEVRWLRHQLDRIDDVVSRADGPQFDERLQQRVMALQQRAGLAVDGIAGPRTLAYLRHRLEAADETPMSPPPSP